MKLVIAEKPSVGAAIVLRAAATLCPGVSGI